MLDNPAVIAVICICICICGVIALVHIHDQEMAKANLHQCLVRGHVLWQKECDVTIVNVQ